MVKQNSSKYVDYKMRTSHSGPMNSFQHNRVQVAHSSGCCSSSKKPSNTPPYRPVYIQQTQTPHQPNAHERTHLKLDSPDPFYYREGRIKKTPHRIRKPFHGNNHVHPIRPTTELRQTNMNQTYPPPPVHPPPKTKTNCCCTIL
jgi:hypothetical protein